jgi:signal transduction histidine kinase/CheY-like chemotaxis protein
MLGFSAKELLTKRLPDLDCVEGGKSVMTWIPRVMVQGKERSETWQRCSDGRLLQVEMSAQYDPENGGQLVVFLRDLSERKRAAAEREKLREQVNQGEKLASVGRLASGIAQDFINMLELISSEVETALVVTGKKEPLHSSLETIAHAAKRSTQITQQLLAFASKQSATPKVVNANDLVASLLPMLRAICGPNFGLTWKPDAALWPVYLDPSHLDQIVVSLCINSRAALAPGGEVNITTGNRSVAAHDGASDISPGDYVTLTVTDNGCGMDAETKSHMFDPFFAMKEMGAGTGLGLATAYGIVQQNNGFIQVQSEPGEGTSITVLLPRFASSAANADPAELIFGARGHETILIVEDEPLVLKVTTRMLSAQGYHVLAASSPAEAIRLASECGERTHLLITDIVMPTMDGRQLASILRQRYTEMKILYVSGHSKDVLSNHGVRPEDGINFEQKPYSMKDLSAKIRSVLDA